MGYKLLSLDTSTASTGWALYINGKYIESGCIKIEKVQNKLSAMVSRLFFLIETKHPDAIIVEEMVVVRNPQVARNLTMILGALYGKCIEENIEWQTLRPTEWRKLVDPGKKPITRKELKEWSKQKAKELFGIDANDDVSDAILIGQAYINLFLTGDD